MAASRSAPRGDPTVLETLGRDPWSVTRLVRDRRGRRLVLREFDGLPAGMVAALPLVYRRHRALKLSGVVRPLRLEAAGARAVWWTRPAGVPLPRAELRGEQALGFLRALTQLVVKLHQRCLFGVELTPEQLAVLAGGRPAWSGLLAAPALWAAPEGIVSMRLAHLDPGADLAALSSVFAMVLDRLKGPAREPWMAEARRLAASLAGQDAAARPSLGAVLAALDRRGRGKTPAAVGEEQRLPRLLGREPLLREIESSLERALRLPSPSGRRSHLLALTGRAGVGKTRVLAALAEWAHAQGVEVYASRAWAGDRRPLGPLEDLIQDAGGSACAEVPGEESPRLGPVAERRRQVETAIRNVLLARRGRRTLFLIEDLDRLAQGALEALSYLVRAVALEETAPAPVGVVVTLRPGDDPERPSPASRLVDDLREEGFAERVRLPPLDPQNVRELLGSYGSGDAAAIDAAVGRSGGNPRFAEELLRAETRRQPPPSSGAEAFERRLKACAAAERRLLEALAILGGPAPLFLLAELVPARDRTMLFETMLRLTRERLLRPSRSLGIDFANRDAEGWVRDRISARRTRELHRLAGQAIEGAPGDRDPGILARHYELGGVKERFLAYGRLAAGDLESSHANERALELYGKLLERSPKRDTALRLELLERVAALRGLVGDFAGAVAAHRQLLELPHDPRRTWQYYRALGEAHRDREDYAAAAEAFDQGLQTLGPGEDLAVADLLTEKAVIMSRSGDAATARGLADMAGSLAADLPPSRELAAVRNRVGAIFHRLGDHERMISHIEEALRISERVGALDLAAICLNNLALYLGQHGEIARAIELCQRSHEMQEKLGDVEATAYTALNLAAFYLQSFDPDRAQHYVELSLKLASRFGKSFIVAGCLNNLAEAHSQRGRYAEALDSRLRALRLMERLGRRRAYPDLLFALVRDYATLGSAGETERHAHRLAQFAGERDDPRLGALAKVALAAAERLRGEAAAAGVKLGEAEATFRDIGALDALSLCLLEAADLDLANGDRGRALLRAGEAHAVAAERNFHPDRALALLLMAEAMLADDPAAAERAVREAEGLARELDQPELRWRAEALAGEVALGKGDRVGAARRFDSAREILDPLVEAIRDKELAYSYMRERRRTALLRLSRENPPA